MRRLLDEDNAQLKAVLAELLSQDFDITVREIARRHPTLGNASAFTRNEQRMKIIGEARRRQQEARAVAVAPHKQKAATLAERLEGREQEIVQLKSQVEALVASHAACVRAVLLHGGMPALERFWSDYKAIGDMVRRLGALPCGANVIDLPAKQARRG
jgi:hypothetical protein